VLIVAEILIDNTKANKKLKFFNNCHLLIKLVKADSGWTSNIQLIKFSAPGKYFLKYKPNN